MSEHKPHPHKPMNVNSLVQLEHMTADINTRIAVALTRRVGSMWTAYLFACLALLGFPALSAVLGTEAAIYVTWLSQTFIQLTMLPILSVGQSVLGHHQELQADEMFHLTRKICHDNETLIEQNNKLIALLETREGRNEAD